MTRQNKLDRPWQTFPTWGHCYKTMYGRKLRIFVISYKPFQDNIVFEGKAGAYPSETPLKYSSLG